MVTHRYAPAKSRTRQNADRIQKHPDPGQTGGRTPPPRSLQDAGRPQAAPNRRQAPSPTSKTGDSAGRHGTGSTAGKPVRRQRCGRRPRGLGSSLPRMLIPARQTRHLSVSGRPSPPPHPAVKRLGRIDQGSTGRTPPPHPPVRYRHATKTARSRFFACASHVKTA